jgi:ABC-2 type transport system permease protein
MLLALIRKELLVLSRDVHGLLALFVLPLIFIVVMSMALKDVYSPHVDNLAWSVIDHDEGAPVKSLLTQWETENGKPQTLPADWQAALREGRLKYLIQIEKGASEDLTATFQASKQTEADHPRIVLLTEPGLDFGVFTALRAQIQAGAMALRVKSLMSNLVAQLPVQTQMAMMGAAQDNEKINQQLTRTERQEAGPRPTSVQHNVPAWLVFGMFFVIAPIAGLFVEERSCGTLARLRSLGLSPLILLLAKMFPYLLINCLQAGLMLAVGVYVMPLLGGDALSLQHIHWPALIAILIAIGFAAISLALLIATLVKTQAQANTVGPMLNILMAAIGGIMIPTFVMPATMQTLSRGSPMNWALEGLLNVLLRGGNLYSIQHEAALLLALAVVSVSLAYLILRLKKI